MSRISCTWSQKIFVALFSVWHSDFFLFMCVMHTSWLLGIGHICACPLELWHTTLKWFCFWYRLHILLIARHSLSMCCITSLTVFYLKLFTLIFGLLLIISQFSYHYVCDQSLSHFSFCLILFFAPSSPQLPH